MICNKVKKIVITGGLGYIGSELCKIYSGESRHNKIVVIDSRFVSERVKQLRDWGIEFIHASILDENVLEKELKDADTIIHLAGITDVAYVATEANMAKDNEIKKIGIEGTRNVLRYMGETCKIIFPSTHVVYEGLKETKKDILETEPLSPILTYASGKAQSEEDIKEWGRNYVILRLASVYGYGGDTMRINIMPNLFSKIASQGGTIKLFSGGVQLKSLVPLMDVARCMKFMEEKDEINKEIFHLSKENMTVKEVAELCKKINPSLTLLETKDEIPNLGYTISNKKLLDTGFVFRYDIESCIREMIENWSKKNLKNDLEYIIEGGKKFVDERGRIVNYELTEPINLIGYIDSSRGTVRANHYHPIQEQKCLLISGEYISVTKDLLIKDSPIETKIIREGDIAVIKPHVAHAMVFTQRSIFLNLVRGEREHENYGITHTIPYKLVDDNLRNILLSSYKYGCRCCYRKDLHKVVSLGLSPLANNLLNSKEEKTELFPLELEYCPFCFNVQLSCVVDPGKMFDNYLYQSSTTQSFRNHFKETAEKYIKEFNLSSNSLVVDIGSNDGIALYPLKERGVCVMGVEPAKNIAEIAEKNGIMTFNSYFDTDVAHEILEYGRPKLITASNVFAHADSLDDIANNVFILLKDNGTFIVEVQYLLDTIKDLTFDNIYHEHVNYWTVTSINNFFNRQNLVVYKVEHINTHGGSIRVYVKRKGCEIESSVQDFLDNEQKFGLLNYETYREFGKRIEGVKRNTVQNIKKLKSKYPVIAGYGSPAKATTALNYFGIDNSYIDYIIEDNPLKHGKFIPGVYIPIKNKEYINENPPSIIIVMAWNFFEEIKKNNQDLVQKGIQFISIKDLQKENFTC